MRYKKHMIILLAAIFLFAMATASAADLNDTAVAVEDMQLTDEIIQASENQENTIQASYNDEVNLSEDDSAKLAISNDKTLGTGTNHTFQDIQDAIDADESTIYLEPGTYTGDDYISISGKNNIKIIGDSTILDAEGQRRIFYISQSSNITIQNIIFKNGYADSNGGAIYVYGSCRDCSISNCTFINNTAEWDGGAVYFNSTGNVINCDFTDNTAKYNGGAVYFKSNGDVINSNFIDNSAPGYGGVIYFDYNVTIKSSSFINNRGDVIIDSKCRNNHNLVVKDSIFLNNSCNYVIYMEGEGSGIADYNWFGDTYLNKDVAPKLGGNVECNVWFYLDVDDLRNFNVGDSKTVNYNLYGYNGTNYKIVYDMSNVSAITFDVSSVYGWANVSSVEFVGGHASVLYASLVDDKNDLTIANGPFSFTLSTSKYYVNGSVSVSGDGSKTGPFRTLKEAYDAAGNGDIIFIASGTYNGSGSNDALYIDKQITLNTYGDGPVIFDCENSRLIFVIMADDVEIRGITFINVNSNLASGVVWKGADGVLCNCSFVNNSVQYSTVVEWIGADGVLCNCSFANNSAQYGAVHWLGSGTITSSIFINNKFVAIGSFTQGGSAIYIGSNYFVTVRDSIFINNSGSSYDIYYVDGNNVLAADYNWFGNTADNYNDPLPINRYVKCDYRLFLNATANPDTITGKDTSNITFKLYQYHSGVVSDYDNAPFKNLDLTITATKGNVGGTAKLGEPIQFTPTRGGTASVTATVENVRQTVEINVKGDFDLLQDLVNNESLSVINLERNYTYNEFDTITDGVRITRPITINGNGYTIDAKGKSRIFYVTAGSINITNVTLKNGKANNGGAIYFVNAISNSNINATYINNTAREGGANNFGSVSGSNVSGTYINNTAEWYGGANHFDSVSTSNVSGTYINNTAKEWGGANRFTSVSTSNISGTYINNKAKGNGGANYFLYGVSTSNISGTYINNKAEWNGGANYFLYGVSDSKITGTYTGNNATRNGGANYFDDSVSGSNITGIYINNTATNGEIIYFEVYDQAILTNVNIENAIFLNNKYNENNGIIYAKKTGAVAKNNWFGNNATNYKTAPKTTGIQMDSWLFLNGTNDQNNIKFFLMSYDGATTSEYDNTLLPKINLTVTSTDGILDKSVVGLDETVKFSPAESGINRITAQIEDAAQTVEVTNGDFDVLQTIINNASENSVINLTRNYTYNQWDKMAEGVLIDKSITINGNGYTIDAKGKSRIFYVTAGSINITNVTLKNGKADRGGAIYFENAISNSNINATYINNTAEWDGGANWFFDSVSGSNVSGTYINNTAERDGGANNFGSVSGSNVSGTYINNTAKRYGGANSFFDRVSDSNIGGIYINNTASSSAIIYFMVYFNAILTNVTIENAIFLNNNYNESMGVIFAGKAGVVAKNNWFGNNATNYNTQPKTTGIQMDSWLFLNATADPNPISVFDSSDILFKLYSTNGTHIYEYDNSKLPVVNLTLTAINGEVSNSTILDKSVEYMPTKVGQGSVTASVEDAEYTIFLDNNKRDVNLSVAVDSQVIDYGENAAVIFEYNVTATGTVNITLKGKKHNQTIENVALNKTITLPDTILPDEYEVTVSYSGDDVFVNASAASSLTVNQLKSDIKVVGYDIYVNDTTGLMFSVTLPENATGNLTISNGIILNVTKEGRKENSSLIIEIMNNAYSVGQYNWTFTYSGDDIYENSQAKSTANILIIPTEIAANATSSLFVDDTGQVTYNVTPENAVGNVKFTSNDTSVVEVDQNGNIKAIAEGTALITVTFEGCENYTSSSTNVTVTVSKIATEITLTNGTVELKAYKSIGDLAKLDPAGAGNLTYASSDEDIVLVSEDGIIYARVKGTATVTVSFAGDNKYKAAESKNITVTVTLNDASVSTENDTIDLYVDDACIINATANPSFLTVYYASSNESVATVTDYGNVKAVGEGTAVITLTVGNGETYAVNSTNVTVTVSKVPTEISIENYTLKLEVTDEVDTGATLTPADAGNVTYAISNSSVVKVKGGKVIALAEGEAAITVSFVGDVKYADAENKTITVNVSLKAAGVSVNNDTLDLFVDDAFNLVATTEPTDLTVNFTSSNPSIVTVDNKGNVVAVGEGTANITVSVGGDGVYAENSTIVTVTVSKIPTEIIVQNATVDMKVGDIFDPVVSLMPSNAGRLSFRSSNDTVVLINGHGMIKAVGEGNATVTVAFDGNEKYAAVSRNITVSVSKQDANINVSMPENITVGENSTVNVVLPDDATGNVTVNVDGEVIDTVAVTDGTADVIIPSLSAGNHTVEIAYLGDDKYNSASKTATITVNKYSTNITAADVSATYKVNKYLVINLTDSKGNPLANSTVTVELSTVKNYTSDENGQIKVKVSSLVPKTYTAKITFKGDEKYTGSNTTAEVTVKKAAAKITAKAKTFKTTTKTKKYTVMLKANGKALKNKWVYLKVNGKTYKAKTNSKGKATFKITQLNKAGKYKATVTFKGNDYYKKATKKATIKVKSVWKTVQKGSKNSAIVKKIQRALKNHGYYLEYNGHYLMVDGIFWDYTEMAVKEFQNDKTLKVTGKVDEKTAKKLGII